MNKETIQNAIKIFKNDGINAFWNRTLVHIRYLNNQKRIKKNKKCSFKDILFINGCPIDYCERYRVIHKMEELNAYGISSDEISIEMLSEDLIKYYSGFIIYRTPWNENIDNFVKLAKKENKIVFYDIDDLVFDLEFTKTIKELKTFSKGQLELYNDGVIRYGKMLECCDYSITTTKTIADEMKKHVKDVCIDKNIASLSMQKYSELAIEKVKKDETNVIIGYASGSITHNADFELILPALLKILDNYNNVYLKLIGVINIPEQLKKYGNRIITSPFVDYKTLPMILRSLDINLAPLEKSIFNEAKSSIKWMEAALVKIPTISSNVGNFHDCITNDFDGVLCEDNEWYEKLEKLILDKKYRDKLAENAYKNVYSNYTSVTSGKTIAEFIKSKLNKKICFLIPATNISGGLMVATKHALMLKNSGFDVTMLNTDYDTRNVDKLYDGENYVNVVSMIDTKLESKIDVLVATMYFTIYDAIKYGKCKNIKYLVQNREDGFYKPDNFEILIANSSYYQDNVDYLTISKWCKEWLEKDFNRKVKYAPNGIDLKIFPFKKRNFQGKIKILIEGDPSSHYKNVDESFKISNKLDPNKFEIIFLSYNAKPKKWYRYNKFYNKINHDEVYKIYQECDILLKSSLLESFSYPPLEMMATGGLNVLVANEGNIEYLIDKKNCLFYEQGNIDDAINKIELLVENKDLRNKIINEGLKTAENRSWNNIRKDILKLYE